MTSAERVETWKRWKTLARLFPKKFRIRGEIQWGGYSAYLEEFCFGRKFREGRLEAHYPRKVWEWSTVEELPEWMVSVSPARSKLTQIRQEIGAP